MNGILYLLVGTYTLGASEGIYLYEFDTLTGDAKYVTCVQVENPSYLATSDDGYFVYAVTENGNDPSYANALYLDKASETLTLLNSEETQGASPCNIAIDPTGKYVVTANYGGGSLSVFSICPDKKLTPLRSLIRFEGKGTDPARQEASHLHCVMFSPDGKYLFATDLGTDRIYRFDTSGHEPDRESFKTFDVAGGSGPRHITFHPSGKFLYLINELSGTVTGFNYTEGDLSAFQTIQADTLYAQGSADIAITPDGKFLYASNRLKGDGIAIFAINPSDGTLTKTGYQETGIHPRNIATTPNGTYLLAACRDSNRIEVYEIDSSTGRLYNTGQDIELDQPVCLKFVDK